MARWMGVDIPFWLVIVIGLALVLLVTLQTPSSSSQSQTSRDSSNRKNKGEPEEKPTVSPAARDVATRLGVTVPAGGRKRRVPVTVFVNDVVLRKERDGEWVAIESAIRVLALLNEVASVFLVSMVGSDLDESLVKDIALSSGLTSPSIASASKTSAALATTPTGIPEHRLLFCSSHIGQVAVVRQLSPSLHIGGPVALLEGICRFVPSLVRIDPSAVEPSPETAALPPPEPAKPVASSNPSSRGAGGYSLEWREFKTLAGAAGLPSPVSPESTTGKGESEAQQPTSDNSKLSGSTAADSGVDVSAAEGETTRGPGPDGTGLGERVGKKGEKGEEAPPNVSTSLRGGGRGVQQSGDDSLSSPPSSSAL